VRALRLPSSRLRTRIKRAAASLTPRGRDPGTSLATETGLSVLLFADIVSSTSRAAEIGNLRWRHLLDEHRLRARKVLRRFGGGEVDLVGDGLFATFGSASAAITCACTLRDTAADLRLTLRIGIHAGESAVLDGKPCGVPVHVAARVAAAADPGAVLATGTVRELLIGCPIGFADRGERSLQGVPGRWRLYEVEGQEQAA
jgi:class 3 adenylate cyclase